MITILTDHKFMIKYFPFIFPILTNVALLYLVTNKLVSFTTLNIFLFQGIPYMIIGFLWQLYGRISTRSLKEKNHHLYKKYLKSDNSGFIKSNTINLLTEEEKKSISNSMINKLQLCRNYGISIILSFVITFVIWILIMVLK